MYRIPQLLDSCALTPSLAVSQAHDASSVLEAAARARHGKFLERAASTSSTRQGAAQGTAQRGSTSRELVVTTTLDALVGTAPCAGIKLDIQGSEHEALLGAGALLRRPPGEAPLLLFELMEDLRADLPNVATVQLVRSHGYVCYDLSSNVDNRLPDGSLRHQHRCCGKRRPSIKAIEGSTQGGKAAVGADRVAVRGVDYKENTECLEWREDASRACQNPLYTDFACVKPHRDEAI